MITLGYIRKLNSEGSNLFDVYLPIFDKAGVPLNEESLSSSVFPANLAYNPGNLNAYKVGDCVVVGFLNNKKSMPIILGKLYTGMEEEATNYSYNSSLTVINDAKLPENTVIGDLSVAKLNEVLLQANTAIDRIDSIIDEIDDIKSQLPSL